MKRARSTKSTASAYSVGINNKINIVENVAKQKKHLHGGGTLPRAVAEYQRATEALLGGPKMPPDLVT